MAQVGNRVLICMDRNGLENALLNTSFKPTFGIVKFIKQFHTEKEPTLTVQGDDGLIYEGAKSCFYTQEEFNKAIDQFKNNQQQTIQALQSKTIKLNSYKFAINKFFSRVKPERFQKISIQAQGKHGTCDWTLDNKGTLRISPSNGEHGVLAHQGTIFMEKCPWLDVAKKVKNVIVEQGVVANQCSDYLFASLVNCEKMDLRGLDMRGTMAADGMFRNCKNLKYIEIENLGLKKTASKNYMFAGCDKLDHGDLMRIEEKGHEYLNMEAEPIHAGTHGSCSWEISKDGELRIFPTDGIKGMLEAQSLFNRESPWKAFANDITSVVVEEGVLAGTDISNLFSHLKECKKMDLSGLCTHEVQSMSAMFAGCEKLESLNVKNLTTSKVRDMKNMFYGCENLKSLDIRNFDFSNVTEITGLFAECKALEKLEVDKINLPEKALHGKVFYCCDKLQNREELESKLLSNIPVENNLKLVWEPSKPKDTQTPKNLDEMSR